MTGRVVIDDIHPTTPVAGYPAKAVVGERVPVSAVIFRDGHDTLAARAELFVEGRATPEQTVPLRLEESDRWTATLVPARIGRHQLVVSAWTDRYASWARRVRIGLDAGQDVEAEIAEAGLLLQAARAVVPVALVDAAMAILDDASLAVEARLAGALEPGLAAVMSDPRLAADLTVAAPKPLWVDRERALVGAWYELFPRSHGGFKGTEERIADVAAMGFDVVYLPPIHPIGVTHRKGRNNALVAGEGDPGSPWAIGSADGGHLDVHPDLGTIEDFRHLVAAVKACGMEVALDYALNCSPDHPWVEEHPEWFHHRADGSIAYAENPPKRYQDIFPLDFWPERDRQRVALWQACKGIVDFWIAQGVRIFRVDNPHTKPVAFWEWLIPAVQDDHPEVIFLAEAFTRPRVMEKLAAVGFSQSYTYFTWRTVRDGPEGLWAYMQSLTQGPAAEYLRPSLWPNTPDILSGPLRNGPPAAFAGRLVLAATLSPSYGVYSGYELYENEPASPDNEEYLDSEKYEIKDRDYDRPDSLRQLMGTLNALRRRHPALQRLRNLRLHPADNPAIFAYSKVSDDGSDAVAVVVNLDPGAAQESMVHLDLEALGLPVGRPYVVVDELSGQRFTWLGPDVFVRLQPWSQVAHVLDLRTAI